MHVSGNWVCFEHKLLSLVFVSLFRLLLVFFVSLIERKRFLPLQSYRNGVAFNHFSPFLVALHDLLEQLHFRVFWHILGLKFVFQYLVFLLFLVLQVLLHFLFTYCGSLLSLFVSFLELKRLRNRALDLRDRSRQIGLVKRHASFFNLNLNLMGAVSLEFVV